MEEFWNAQWLKKPYTISYKTDKLDVIVSKENVQLCGNHDMWVLDFLYRSYRKQLNGCIINLEDMNAPLQLSIFLAALKNAHKLKPILILSPDDEVVKWHYFMTQCTGFRVETIFRQCANLDDNFEALIIGHSDLKLCENLYDFDFFSVIIDKFDEIASKMVLRKLRGQFNVGVTYRNFYTNPDQKLHWTMLNWANPGSVGRLANFYEIDNDNFANFRDNYKEWWFRITWTFCESFTKPTIAEKGKLLKMLKTWAADNDLMKFTFSPVKKRKRKEDEPKTVKKKLAETEKPKVRKFQDISDNSSDTIIFNDFKVTPQNSLDAEELLPATLSQEPEKISLAPDLPQQSGSNSDSDLMDQLFGSQKTPKNVSSDLLQNSPSSELFETSKKDDFDLGQHSDSNAGNELIEQLFVSPKTQKTEMSEVDQLVAEVMDLVRQE